MRGSAIQPSDRENEAFALGSGDILQCRDNDSRDTGTEALACKWNLIFAKVT